MQQGSGPQLIHAGGVADHFKTQEICEKAVEKDPYMLGHIPDWFLTQQQVGP